MADRDEGRQAGRDWYEGQRWQRQGQKQGQGQEQPEGAVPGHELQGLDLRGRRRLPRLLLASRPLVLRGKGHWPEEGEATTKVQVTSPEVAQSQPLSLARPEAPCKKSPAQLRNARRVAAGAKKAEARAAGEAAEEERTPRSLARCLCTAWLGRADEKERAVLMRASDTEAMSNIVSSPPVPKDGVVPVSAEMHVKGMRSCKTSNEYDDLTAKIATINAKLALEKEPMFMELLQTKLEGLQSDLAQLKADKRVGGACHIARMRTQKEETKCRHVTEIEEMSLQRTQRQEKGKNCMELLQQQLATAQANIQAYTEASTAAGCPMGKAQGYEAAVPHRRLQCLGLGDQVGRTVCGCYSPCRREWSTPVCRVATHCGECGACTADRQHQQGLRYAGDVHRGSFPSCTCRELVRKGFPVSYLGGMRTVDSSRALPGDVSGTFGRGLCEPRRHDGDEKPLSENRSGICFTPING